MGWGRSKGGKGGSKGGSNGKDDKDGDVVPQSGFFGGGGYASFGDYMVEKNRKLKEQFAAAAATSGETGKATIFRGLSFWMTGRTCLPDQELKRIIVEHGGVYEQYGFTHVTHIIADNLASGNQTWAELKKRSKRVNVVTSSWVTACVQEGRRLPEMRFMPKCLSSGSSMLSFLDQPDARKPTPAEGPEDADASVSSHRGDVDDVAQKQSLDLTCEETQPCSAEQVEEGEDPSAPAKKRRKSIVSVDSEHLLSQTPQRIQQNFATSALAFEVNTSCTEGLAGFNELLEVLSDLAAGAAQQLSEQGRCAAAVGLKITLGQRQAEWSGMAGTEGHGGQEVLLTTLTSLAHRAVAALGLSTGLTAETAHGKVHIDPDAGYRAVCHVGIQLHFQHGQASGRQEPALAKPSKPDRGGQDLTGPAGRETTCSSAANQPTVPLALRPEVAEMASTSCAGILSGPTVRPSTKHRSRWKVLPMWAPDVSAQQLMDHWRAICHRVQGLQKGSVSEWHKVCHPRAGHTPGVAASLDLHVYAFEDLLARKEFEVVHLALRALRAAVKSRVACTLRGDGQLPTPSHFNALLSAVQLSLAGDSGARFKVAPLALPETAEKSQTTVPCSGSDTAAEIVSSAHAKLRWGE